MSPIPDYDLGTARGRIELDASGVDRESKKAKKSVDDLEPSLSTAVAGFGILSGAMSALKTPAMVQGLLLAVGALGSMVAGAVSVVSALAPLVGMLPAIATGYLALAQGMGVVKLATAGVSDALKIALKGGPEAAAALDEALKGMDPSARTLVTTIAALKPQFEGLRNLAQAGLFPGVIDSINLLSPLIDTVLRPIVGATASALGNLAKTGGEMLSELGSEIRTLGLGNIPIIENLGNAIINLAPSIIVLLTAAQPLMVWLSELLLEISQGILYFVRAGEESGKLAAFFDKTKTSIELLLGILGPLLNALGQIGSVAHSSGVSLLSVFGDAMAKFNMWAESMEGQTWLREFFELAQPVMIEFGKLAGELFVGLMQAAKDIMPIMPPIIELLRTKLLPAILSIAQNIDEKFIIALVNLAVAFAEFFVAFSSTTPLLTAFVVAITPILGIITTLLTDIPFLSPVISNLATAFSLLGVAMGAMKVARFVSEFGGIRAGIEGARKATVLHTIATKLAAMATQAWTAAQWLFNAAMAANPIALVIIAVAALIAIGILLWQHWDKVKAVVNALWQGIQAAWDGIVNIFMWAKDRIWAFISEWGILFLGPIGFIIKFRDEIGDALGKVVGFFTELPGKILGFLGNLVSGAGEKLGELIGWFSGLPGRLLEAIGDIGSKMLQLGKDIVQGIINGVGNLAGALADKIRSVITAPLGAVGRFLGADSPSKLFKFYGESVVQGMQKGLDSLPSIKLPPIESALQLASTGGSLPVNGRGMVSLPPSNGAASSSLSITIPITASFGDGFNAEEMKKALREVAREEIVDAVAYVVDRGRAKAGARSF